MDCLDQKNYKRNFVYNQNYKFTLQKYFNELNDKIRANLDKQPETLIFSNDPAANDQDIQPVIELPPIKGKQNQLIIDGNYSDILQKEPASIMTYKCEPGQYLKSHFNWAIKNMENKSESEKRLRCYILCLVMLSYNSSKEVLYSITNCFNSYSNFLIFLTKKRFAKWCFEF